MVSAGTKRAMEEATPEPPITMQAANTLPDFPVAVAQADAGTANQQWSA
jgi:hypothetical protein